MSEDEMVRSTTRERRLARADRLEGWAAKREVRAAADFATARARAEMIPFGQPILVGHYSEGRDRRFRASIDAAGFRGLESARMADSMQSRASTIRAQADHAVYSDDVDAVERLQERIARCVNRELVELRAFNKLVKAAKGSDVLIAAAIVEFPKAGREYLGWVRAFSFAAGKPLPLTNKTAALRKDQLRLVELQRVPS